MDRSPNAVCFELGSDWDADGRFQGAFFGDDREMLPGMSGFALHLSPHYLQIDLTADVDPETWLSELPSATRTHPAVSATYIGACRAD